MLTFYIFLLRNNIHFATSSLHLLSPISTTTTTTNNNQQQQKGSYADVATLSCLSKYTGGSMNYYQNFHHQRDGERLSKDIRRVLLRETAWESVARVRVTQGCRISAFYGNYYIRGADLLALPNCSADWTVGLEITHDAQTLQSDSICVQSALLFTTSRGERRIRVNTIALPVTTSETDIFKNVNTITLSNLMIKSATQAALTGGFATGQQKLVRQCTDIVRGWRQANSAYGGPNMQQQNNSPGDLPPNMLLLPLYVMAMIKSPALRGGNTISFDQRSFVIGQLMNMPLEQSASFVYPKMYAIHTLTSGSGGTMHQEASKELETLSITDDGKPMGHVAMPPLVGLSSNHLTSDGAYLMDTGLTMFMWFGRAVSPTVVQHLFGIPGLEGIDTTQLRLNPGGNDLCDRVNNLVRALRSRREVHTPLLVLQEGSPTEPLFFTYLVEDRQNFAEGAVTYPEFLQKVQSGGGGGSGMGMPGQAGGIPPSQQRRY